MIFQGYHIDMMTNYLQKTELCAISDLSPFFHIQLRRLPVTPLHTHYNKDNLKTILRNQ